MVIDQTALNIGLTILTGSALWTLFDVLYLSATGIDRLGLREALFWTAAVFLLWLPFFPLYLYKRHRWTHGNQ